MSHPMWVRGLKHLCAEIVEHNEEVAPYVGAWIETSTHWRDTPLLGRTLCGCVD